MYSLHNLEVVGIAVAEVLACEIESRFGEHSTLTLLARVDTEEEFVYELPECHELEVLLHGEGGAEPVFVGIITDIRMCEEGKVRTVRIEGKSRSWLMDRTRQSRSFQNTKMSFQALVRDVLKNYEDYTEDSLIYVPVDQKIGSLLVQYEETDWEFLQRALSLAGLALTPDSRQKGLKLYAGVPSLTETVIPHHILEMDKDMETYYLLKANGRSVCAADFTRYRVSSERILGIFEPIAVQGQFLTVASCEYSFETQEMTGVYSLQSHKALIKTASYPMHLIGVAMKGKVVKVSGTKVQVAMGIDGRHTKRAVYWFPYSTLSASADGSGWYCMPEKGDEVRIYFPSKQEAEAIALSAVSNYNAPRDGSRDRMSDPNSRYLRTKSGQELALAPDYMKLSCGEDASSVTIQTDGKVIVQAKTKVSAESQEELTLHAEEELIFHVREQFRMRSLNGGSIESEEGNIIIQGTEVQFDGSE